MARLSPVRSPVARRPVTPRRRRAGNGFHNVLVAILTAVVVMPALYGVALLNSAPSALPNPPTPLATIEADVVLFVPYNGSTVHVVVTASTDPSTPLVETLGALYSPTGNGSSATFSSYYGRFVAGVVNLTGQPQGMNVSVTVNYDGVSKSGNGTIMPGEESVLISVIIGHAGLRATSPATLSTANGATECPLLGGSWDKKYGTCTFSEPTSLSSLTIGSGVTLEAVIALEMGGIINHGVITAIGIIDGIPGTTIENDGFIYTVNGGYFTNVGTLLNNGTINNGGTFTNTLRGVLNNLPRGTILNYGKLDSSGALSNNGTILNLYGVIHNMVGSVLLNYGTLTNYQGLSIYNWYVIKNYGNFYNWGTLYNTDGTIWIIGYHEIAGNSPIGGSVIYD